MRETTHFDAIVVGSGISGGWAAKELTEHGLKTLVLEAGGPVDPNHDFVEHVQPWRDALPRTRRPQAARGRLSRAARLLRVRRDGPQVLREGRARIRTRHPDDAPFKWFRGRHVGGRSITWGRQVYRWSDLDFDGERQGRPRQRLADPLRRHRAVVLARRALHRRHRRARRTCRSCPTASSCRRCR